MITRRKALIGGAALTATPFVLGGAASAIAIHNNKAHAPALIAPYTIPMMQWPASLSLSVAYISDIHLGLAMDAPRLADIFNAVNALKVDLVLLGGDYFDASRSNWNVPVETDALLSLRNLETNGGRRVIGVPGNHDWKYGIETIKGVFADANVPLLQNQSHFILKDGHRVWIAGLDSQWGARATLFGGRDNHADVTQTFRNIPAGEPTIVLMHEPDMFAALPDQAHVCFAGHTHGGQIEIGNVKPLTWLRWQFTRGLVHGHAFSRDLKRQIIVSSGLGCSRVPVRTLAPEIVHVHLRGMRP